MATSRLRSLIPSALLVLVTAGCPGDGLSPPDPETSFSRIQEAVLTPACITCHTAGTQYANESGLVLDGPAAYANLVGAPSTNATARSQGMVRVRPFMPDSSLLYYKLRWEPEYHVHDYGSPMPLGGVPLSVGQIEFIRQWIAAGAPATDDAIDPTLLADTTSPDLTPFEALPLPAQGYQLTTDRFGVAPNFERELFVYRPLGNAAPIYINRIETKMRANSHHFVVYSMVDDIPAARVPQPNQYRDLRNPDGSPNFFTLATMEYHVFFAGAMTGSSDYQFPAGVAMRLPANASLDLNSHYVNYTKAELPGEAYANLHTVDSALVQHVARALFLNNLSITLPPEQRTTITRSFTVNTRTTVLMLASHMHRRGEHFVIRIAGGPRAGEIVYESNNWSHPVMRVFDVPLILESGEGLTSEVTYYNESPFVVRFGLTSEDEMGIIFGYAY